MFRLRSFSKPLVCVMLAGGLTPAVTDAKLPPSPIEFESQQANPARPPRVVIVASDNVTVVRIIDCLYLENVGVCIDLALAAEGTSLSTIDTNRTGRFIQGLARVGSVFGPRAVNNVNYGYDDLFIEGDIKIRAQE